MLLSSGLTTHAQAEPSFSLSSTNFQAGARLNAAQVMKGFGCEGGNLSPALQWKNAPAGTRSFAVTAYDPDAPTGSGWWHWLVFNLPADSHSLPEGAGAPDSQKLPAGAVQSRTDYGSSGYGGACPPPGDKAHRYIFTVYALKVPKLDLDANASGAMVGYFLKANALASAQITALYGR